MRTTIGQFILDRLTAIGITEIIGVPGDFNLNFLEQIRDADGIRFVGTCNELNAAYAADGYARQRGIGALLTTYGVGELSALNGLAGSRAEGIPVVSLAGAPPEYATEHKWTLHHSLADGNFDNMLQAIEPFTAVCTRLSPASVVEDVDRALRACWREKRPVHIQVPSDITHLTIEVPDEPFQIDPWTSDPRRLRDAVDNVVGRLRAARRPVLLVDQNTEHYGYAPLFQQLVDKAQLPFVQLSSGKAILSETHPLFRGTYVGAGSPADVRELVEDSDLLLTNNPMFVEANSGAFTARLPHAATVNIGNQHVRSGDTYFTGIRGDDVLAAIIDRLEPAALRDETPAPPQRTTADGSFAPRPDAPLTHARLWDQFGAFIVAGDAVFAEAGTSNIGLGTQRLPAGVTYVNSSIWGAIGYTLPAVFGSQLANPQRRHLLFIGDGSFQLTAQELSSVLREGLNPIIVLVNNRGYTIERYILGMQDDYNDIANWDYGALPRVFAPDTTMRSYSAATEGELADALADIRDSDRGAFLEVHLDPEDAPAGLKKFGPATADFDYGPLGPRNP